MMNESKTEGAVAVLAGLVKDGLLSIKEAAHRANMTESAFEAEVKKLSWTENYLSSAKNEIKENVREKLL